jgi:hypothetical protein
MKTVKATTICNTNVTKSLRNVVYEERGKIENWVGGGVRIPTEHE